MVLIGLHTKADPLSMGNHLRPLLQHAKTFFDGKGKTGVDIYILATAGMRGINDELQTQIRQHAHNHIRTGGYGDIFNHGGEGAWETRVRVITGQHEGLYAWAALNKDLADGSPNVGILELGGISMQIAYESNVESVHRQAVHLSGMTRQVYSRSWNAGADIKRKLMLGRIALVNGQYMNPCLRRGQRARDMAIIRDGEEVERDFIGTGNFDDCKVLTQQLLETFRPIVGQILPQPDRFVAVANLWYSYEYFSRTPNAQYDARGYYDRERFEAAVGASCNGCLTEGNDKFTNGRCFNAAWMHEMLHNENRGFKMNRPMELRDSTWTLGAAALYAAHGDLVFIPPDDKSEEVKFFNVSRLSHERPAIAPSVSYSEEVDFRRGGSVLPFSKYYQELTNGCAFGVLHIAAFVFVVVALLVSIRRRTNARSAPGPISLPKDIC